MSQDRTCHGPNVLNIVDSLTYLCHMGHRSGNEGLRDHMKYPFVVMLLYQNFNFVQEPRQTDGWLVQAFDTIKKAGPSLPKDAAKKLEKEVSV